MTNTNSIMQITRSLNYDQPESSPSKPVSRCESRLSFGSKKSVVRSFKIDNPADDLSQDAYNMFIQEGPVNGS